MLEIDEIHKPPALQALVDKNNASPIVANHFYLAPIFAEEHKQITIDKLCSHLLPNQIRQPIKTGAQVNRHLKHEHPDMGLKL